MATSKSKEPNAPSEARLERVFQNVDPSRLTEKDWEAVFYLHSDEYFQARRKAHPEWPTIVAEGDSWFEYPLRHEIVHYLKKVRGFHVKSVSHHGDELDDMVYGFEQITRTKRHVKKYLYEEAPEKKILLFSAGGNDIAGSELDAFLNHRRSLSAPPTGALREKYADYVIFDIMKPTYEDFFRTMAEAAGPNLQIISHGYGYAPPDGRPAKYWFIKAAGPWLEPALHKKGYDKTMTEGRQIVKQLIDRFNRMLYDLSRKYQNYTGGDIKNFSFHYLNLRRLLDLNSGSEKWQNELHPNARTFKAIAKRFVEKMDF